MPPTDAGCVVITPFHGWHLHHKLPVLGLQKPVQLVACYLGIVGHHERFDVVAEQLKRRQRGEIVLVILELHVLNVPFAAQLRRRLYRLEQGMNLVTNYDYAYDIAMAACQ